MNRVGLLALAVSLAGAFVAHAGISAVQAASPCAGGDLRLQLSTEGTATQAVAFLGVRSRHDCVVSGPVVFDVVRGGVGVRIRHNPLTIRVYKSVSADAAVLVADFWWANWCGARSGFTAVAAYRGTSVHTRFRTLPVCLDAQQPSSLVAIHE